MLSEAIKTSIDNCVLCWLATSSVENIPNVSPKEVYTHFSNDSIIIANIASPQTVKNIKENEQVCVSFIDVFEQKGFQLKGVAKIITKVDKDFDEMAAKLLSITKGLYPFKTITKITIQNVKEIIAPSYFLFPDETVEEKIVKAKRNYGV